MVAPHEANQNFAQRHLASAEPVEAEAVLLRSHTDEFWAWLAIVLRFPAPINAADPNCALEQTTCACGQTALTLVAIKPILPQEPLTVAAREASTYTYITFDGSARNVGKPNGHGGAAAVLWQVIEGDLMPDRPVLRLIQPVPRPTTAPEMEAVASTLAVQLALQYAGRSPATIAGDNLGVIRHWQGQGRLKTPAHLRLIASSERDLVGRPVIGKWIYIPRERNEWADAASKEAADLARQGSDSLITLQYQANSRPSWVSSFEREVRNAAATWHVNEAPSVPAELKRAVRQPGHAPQTALAAVGRYLTNGSGTRSVEYCNPAAGRAWSYGRKYAFAAGAARLPKTARLLLFGRTHHEIDLVGSFLSLVISHSTRQQFPALRTATQVRHRLSDLIRATAGTAPSPAFAKLTINRTIMKGAGSGMFALRQEYPNACWTGSRAYLLLLQVQRAATMAVNNLMRKGYRAPAHATSGNRAYYILESAGAAFMRVFIRALILQGYTPSSMIWLRDGIWIAPRPSVLCLRKAHRAARTTLGHGAAQLAVTDLRASWEEAMREQNLPFVAAERKRPVAALGLEVEIKKTKRRRADAIFRSRPDPCGPTG